MAAVYGGDEVNAIVIDTGTGSTKAGYAGEDTPKAVFPTSVGALRTDGTTSNGTAGGADGTAGEKSAKEGNRKFYVGNMAFALPREHMEVVSPFDEEDVLADWDVVEEVWKHALLDRLRVNPQEHPMLLSEVNYNPRPVREKMVELIFEKFNVPCTFLAKNAVLSSFACGKQTSLVVDCGYRSTSVAAVHDGYVLTKSVTRSPAGGRLLSACMLKSIEAKGTPVRARYQFRRFERTAGQFDIEVMDPKNITPSYHAYMVEQITSDIKETVSRVSDNFFVEEQNSNIPTVSYELPDGTEIQVGPDRFKVPECMFQPKLLHTFADWPELKGTELQSLPEMMVAAVNKVDVDARRDLYGGIILTGGSSLFNNMRERLEKEIGEIAPQVAKVKVICPANTLERRFSVWIGGSILASLGSFQQLWMSKQEFEETGASLIHRKAP